MSHTVSTESKLFASQLAERVEEFLSIPGRYDEASQLWVNAEGKPLAGFTFRFAPSGGPSQMVIQTGGGATNIIAPDTIPSISDPLPDAPQMDGFPD